MENIKIGAVVFWNKNGARVYWRTDLNDPVDFLSEEFLEGTSDDGHPYSEKFAYDVPHEGRPINPSMIDTVAGSITGAIEYKNGIGFYPLRFPFTFYNLDGQNHDDSSKTLKVYVNAEDISMDTTESKTDKENKALVDSVLSGNSIDKSLVAQNENTASKTPWLTIVIIIVVVALIGLALWYINKSNSKNLEVGITVPTNRIIPI